MTMGKIQNNVVIVVEGGVVQEILTDFEPDRVRFTLLDYDIDEAGDTDLLRRVGGDLAFVGRIYPGPLDVYDTLDLTALALDLCTSDADVNTDHRDGLAACRSPRQYRRLRGGDGESDDGDDDPFDLKGTVVDVATLKDEKAGA